MGWDISSRKEVTGKTPVAGRVKRQNVFKYFTAQQEAVEKKITTEEGILLRMNRLIQATGVFAMIKEDMAFRRFLLRGKRNVSTKWHLISIAYNIQKLHHKKTNRPVGNTLDYTKGGLTTPHSKKAHFFGRNLKIIPEFWG